MTDLVKFITIRLPMGLLRRVEAIAGRRGRSKFVRTAIEEKLEREE